MASSYLFPNPKSRRVLAWLDILLAGAAEGPAPGRNVLGDGRTSSHEGPGADAHRRHQRRVAAHEHTLLDVRHVFVHAVVVAGDGPSPDVGAGANIGAGTITCNYDGVHKHVTHIEQGVFVGSNTALVAPVRIGAGALVAAGSTITQDVPAGRRAFGRARQKNIKPSQDPS